MNPENKSVNKSLNSVFQTWHTVSESTFHRHHELLLWEETESKQPDSWNSGSYFQLDFSSGPILPCFRSNS